MVRAGCNCRTCRWFSEKFDIDDTGYVFDYPYCEVYGVLDGDWTPCCEAYDNGDIGELNM